MIKVKTMIKKETFYITITPATKTGKWIDLINVKFQYSLYYLMHSYNDIIARIIKELQFTPGCNIDSMPETIRKAVIFKRNEYLYKQGLIPKNEIYLLPGEQVCS